MGYEEFKQTLKAKLEERLQGTDIKVYIEKVVKNNQVVKEVLTFQEAGINGMPAIHLQEFYQCYLEHEDMNTMVERTLEILETKAKVEKEDIMGKWDTSKKKIEAKLINYEWNKEMLEDVPHFVVHDLAVVLQLNMGEISQGLATMLIKNPFLKEWGITTEELWEATFENLNTEEFQILRMGEVIADMLGKEFHAENDNGSLFVFSNKRRMFGAVAMLRDDLLEQFAENIKSSFFILPSSTHEVVLVPDNDASHAEGLKEMVTEINQTQVIREEQLSNNVYFYDYKKKELFMK